MNENHNTVRAKMDANLTIIKMQLVAFAVHAAIKILDVLQPEILKLEAKYMRVTHDKLTEYVNNLEKEIEKAQKEEEEQEDKPDELIPEPIPEHVPEDKEEEYKRQ